MSTTTTQTLDASQIQERIVRFRQVREAIIQQIHNVIIGQDEVIEQVLIALFVGGIAATLAYVVGIILKNLAR